MISYIEGKIISQGVNHVVILTGGIGYKVFLPQESLDMLGQKEQASQQTALWIHQIVREDALDLYGFIDQQTLAFFELLIGISGIGPKTALSILNLASVKSIRSAVIAGDPDRLTKVSGIGKKNAEKIVLELKSKIIAEDDEEGKETSDDSDALEALKGLGYSERAAREALKKLDKKAAAVTAGEKVKQALKILAK